VEQLEVAVGQFEQSPSQRGGEFSSPGPLIGVRAVVFALRIVKDRKQRHDIELRAGGRVQTPAVLQNPRPMRHAVCASSGSEYSARMA